MPFPAPQVPPVRSEPQPQAQPGEPVLPPGPGGDPLTRPAVLVGAGVGIAVLCLVAGFSIGRAHPYSGSRAPREPVVAADGLGVREAQSAAQQSAAAEEYRKLVEEQQRRDSERQAAQAQEQLSRSADEAARAADERARRMPFGGSYTFPDGLKVTMAPLKGYTPERNSWTVLPKDATFVRISIAVENTSAEEISLYGSGMLFVKDSDGNLLHPTNGEGEYKSLPDSLRPGAKSTLVESYGVPRATDDPFTVSYAHSAGTDRRDVLWSGSPEGLR
ncbi:DUF4352 domain-containing protein [Kitasatospora sp. NA04385]|uniref:DUF4352 domain-containing protein n=1 Tax=Kitasatospora sp. NA04385 TaxID=2742135 RepID=UPI001590D7AA|nr:DUF4352 domain-containing protein [Kitasatospora sp. NA04385]QKW18324.1 DUF4352 domain-containing protein [Kitasatospora sp. NA04385]